jgi:DNA processing protein
MTDRERLILLNLVSEVGSNRLRRLLDTFSSLADVFSASESQLTQVEGIGPKISAAIAHRCRDSKALERELKLASQHKVEIITMQDPGYPQLLAAIHDPPLALYMKGKLPEGGARGPVAVVGTRVASAYGLQVAQRLGYDLALREVVVVSGMAKGIDAAAHRGALRAQGITLAILGSGLLRIYPSEHEELAAQIVESGAVVSEQPLTMDPLAHNFPRRNRIISGLSRAVVVVEAASRSGAIITADLALEQGREVFAVPGPITARGSQGTNQLLKQGAGVLTSVEDIIEELDGVAPQPQAGSDDSSRVMACLDAKVPRSMDQLHTASRMDRARLSVAILQLELERRIRQLPGKFFIRL